MSSGDARTLVWTGSSGSFNSCHFLADSSSCSRSSQPHIPSTVTDDAAWHTSLLSIKSATNVYDQLINLPVPSFAGQHMRFPCICIPLGPVSSVQNASECAFRAHVMEFRTKLELPQFETLFLDHPWIDFLLDRQPVGNTWETVPGMNVAASASGWLFSHLVWPSGRRAVPSSEDVALLPAPLSASPIEKQMRILSLVGRLRQPFRAMLLTPTRQRVEEYRRVAPESLIKVQVEETTPKILDELVRCVRVLDVL